MIRKSVAKREKARMKDLPFAPIRVLPSRNNLNAAVISLSPLARANFIARPRGYITIAASLRARFPASLPSTPLEPRAGGLVG
ncbi:MAG TPA: hypothetical protein VFZ23_00395, partial [Pyrinomonadaceae bacterium]